MKRMHRIVVCLLVMLVCVQSTVKAEDGEIGIGFDYEVNQAIKAPDETHNDSIVQFSRVLHDLQGNPRYIFTDYGEDGYAVYDVESGIVIESGSISKEIYLNDNAYYVYNGPFSYYEKTQGALVDLLTGEWVELNALVDYATGLDEYINQLEEPIAETQKLPLPEVPELTGRRDERSSSGSDYYLSNAASYLPNYSQWQLPYFYNCCGSVAAAMWLRYMDDQYNDAYIPNSQETTDGVVLIGNLISIIEPADHSGATPQDVMNGIGLYFYLAGVNRPMHNEDFHDGTARALIYYDIPVLSQLGNSSYSHWVVLWKSIIEGGVIKFYCRDGGGDPNYKVFYLNSMVY